MEVSKIKLARQRAGLTQKKVYELLGIPIRTLQDWESLKNKQPLLQEKLVIEKLNSTQIPVPTWNGCSHLWKALSRPETGN